MINYLNKNFKDLDSIASQYKEKYINAEPFPNIVFDNFFNENILNKILENFPSNIKTF